VPAAFIAGAADWGTYQSPGVVERLGQLCPDWRGQHLVPGAGPWVPQEQAEAVTGLLGDFLAR
jgi:pimeloyl-ACP methyl ester carboxylesterase